MQNEKQETHETLRDRGLREKETLKRKYTFIDTNIYAINVT